MLISKWYWRLQIFPMEEPVEVLSVRLFTMLNILSKNGKIRIRKKLFVEGSTFFLHAISPDNFLIISLCSGLLQKTMVRDHSNITSAFFKPTHFISMYVYIFIVTLDYNTLESNVSILLCWIFQSKSILSPNSNLEEPLSWYQKGSIHRRKPVNILPSCVIAV